MPIFIARFIRLFNMVIPEKIKSFLKPNKVKIIVALLIVVYALYIQVSLWGHSFSPFPRIIIMPLFLTGVFSLILILPYSYIIACLAVGLFNLLKRKRLLLFFVAVISVFLFGIDEPLINSTVNRPDYSCSLDTDCVVKSVSRGWCGNPQCVNQNWDYYDSMINDVFALSCRSPLISCSCVKNKCESNDLYESTNLEDCQRLQGYLQKECIRVVSQNMNKDTETQQQNYERK